MAKSSTKSEPQATQFMSRARRSEDADEACLVRLHPPGLVGGPVALRSERFLIGRDTKSDLLIEGEEISRQHALIERRAGRYYVSDLGSRNGTFVDEVAVKEACVLASGAQIRLGKVVLQFLEGGDLEREYHETLYRMMVSDGLTGVANKRWFMENLQRELVRARRHKRPLCLAMLDLDHFKAINDRHGHLAGDDVLRAFCARVAPIVREDESLARYGGEEFVVLMPEAELPAARRFCERVLKAVRDAPFDAGGQSIPVTVSIGLAGTKCKHTITPSELIAAADACLYDAKRDGRDRLVARGDVDEPS